MDDLEGQNTLLWLNGKSWGQPPRFLLIT